LQMALNFAHAGEESVLRCVLLSYKAEVPQNLSKIFRVLTKYLCREYVGKRLEKAVLMLPVACINSYAKTVQVIEKFFDMIYFVNQIVVMVQKHFFVHLLPHMTQSANELTACENEKNRHFFQLEEKIAEGLGKSISALTSAFELIISKQSTADFNIRNDAKAEFNVQVTQTCIDAINFIKQMKSIFEKNLDGKNVDSVLAEFGNRICSVLLEHFKKFRVSQGMGGFRFLQDLTAYRDCAHSFNNKHTLERFEILKEIATVHHVAPENLKVLFTDTKLAKLSKSTVIDFIKQRSDFRAWWVGKYIPADGY